MTGSDLNLEKEAQQSVSARGSTVPSPEPNWALDKREEIVVRLGDGTGEVLENGKYIRLNVAMFKPSGERDGSYKGIVKTVGPLDPRMLTMVPPQPTEPIDQPGAIEVVPPLGYYKATWTSGDNSTLTALGPAMVSLIPLTDGSFMFETTDFGCITRGTGRYKGARGTKISTSAAILPPGADLGQTGATLRAKTVFVFRLVKGAYVAPTPASEPPTAVSSPPPLPAGMGKDGASASLAPNFPKGVDPETYRLEVVQELLKRAAYFTIFNVANPQQPNKPILSSSGAMIGVEVNEELHRFDIQVERPTVERGLRAINRLGDAVGKVHIRWMVIPDGFEAAPGREPPPTPLDPSRSQRFTMLDGSLRFLDRLGSGIDGFGSGRTFPVMVSGKSQLRIGAVIDVLKGYGALQGVKGTLGINGYIEPPEGLALSLTMRIMDPEKKLDTPSALAPLHEIPNSDPGSLFLVFLGEPNRDRWTTGGGPGSGDRPQELLRLVHVSFDLGTSKGLRSQTTTGLIVGSVSGDLWFNPSNNGSVFPIPFQTANGHFTFFDREGKTIGTLRANIVEGRAFRTELHGAPMPVFRFGGFGPFLGGTGQFSGAVGMMSVNSAVSIFPRTFSNFYVLRISDPDGRFHEACRAVWS
jgi:hypothetical protein